MLVNNEAMLKSMSVLLLESTYAISNRRNLNKETIERFALFVFTLFFILCFYIQNCKLFIGIREPNMQVRYNYISWLKHCKLYYIAIDEIQYYLILRLIRFVRYKHSNQQW